MSELCAWDLDGTLRPGSLLADVIQHGAAEGFIDLAQFKDPRLPSYDEVGYFTTAITQQSRRTFQLLMNRLSDEAREQTYPWALERIAAQRDKNVVVFSHSPDFVVKAFVKGLEGVHHARGSYFHTKEHIFSGRAVTLNKPQAVRRYMREKQLETLAFAAGDSTADVPILQKAAHAVIVNPNENLTEQATANGWEIVQT